MPAIVDEAPKANCSIVFLYDAFANPQSQACPFKRFGCKKRLEEMLGMFRSDSQTGIAN
jgi:hypothetical protein